jgi:hypothetical protein
MAAATENASLRIDRRRKAKERTRQRAGRGKSPKHARYRRQEAVRGRFTHSNQNDIGLGF